MTITELAPVELAPAELAPAARTDLAELQAASAPAPTADSGPDPDGGLVRGGSVLAAAMIVTNAGNYALNLLLGRWLPADRFADANLMVTITLVLTVAATSIQLVAARTVSLSLVGTGADVGRQIVRWIERRAALAGLVAGGALALAAGPLRQLLHTASVWPFVILAAGMPFYLAQAAGRGLLQGRQAVSRLASTFLVEMVVRLGVGCGLVAAGAGVAGATVGLSLSFVASWVAARVLIGAGPGRAEVPTRDVLRPVLRYARLTAVLLVAQVIVNNSDVLVSKRYLNGTDAGRYAAVALIGRAVFFLTWSVATVSFAAVAARHASGRSSAHILRGSLLAVAGLGGACALGAGLVGGPVLGVALGPGYRGLSGPLASYALVTTVFAMCSLIATHHLSTGRVTESWLLLAGGVVQTAFLLRWHADIHQLIAAQAGAVIVMAVLVTAAGRVWPVPSQKASVT